MPGAPRRVRIKLDLNSPVFQETFFALETTDLKQVVASLRRVRELDWHEFYRHTGFQWEAVHHLKAPNGTKVYSLRLGQRMRAIAYREDDFLRVLSLHPDHDSAYKA